MPDSRDPTNGAATPDPLAEWRDLWPRPESLTSVRDTLGGLLDDYYRWHARHQPHAPTPSSPSSHALLQRSLKLLRALSERLQAESAPWPASAYLAHMNTDVALPAALAYFVAMLYNPNNVTPDASPVTTALEYELSDDFCRLFDFDPRNGWAHLTSGGHASNYEAIWIARNLQCVPFAIAGIPELKGLLQDDDPQALCNLSPRTLAQWLGRAIECGRLDAVLESARALHAQPLPGERRLLVPANRHYAWDKCADLLGVTLEAIDVDATMRIDIDALRARVFDHLQSRRPIVAVVATVGSSGEGSVDPIDRIVALRRECDQRFGASFFLHVDAAFGGYYRSLLVPACGERASMASARDARGPRGPFGPDVAHALLALREADTITVDSHKCGYVPYPAGGLAIRDRRYSQVVSRQSRYFGQAQSRHMDFGPYTLEGARPGAATAAVWAAHRLIGLHRDGYGSLLAENLRTVQRLHRTMQASPAFSIDGRLYRLQSVYEPDLAIVNFFVRPLIANASVGEEITLYSERIIGRRTDNAFGAEHAPWLSRNEIALRRLMPDCAEPAALATVVRCCVMKPVAECDFPAFWRTLREAILTRVGGDEVAP